MKTVISRAAQLWIPLLSPWQELEQLGAEDLVSIGLTEEKSYIEIDRKGSVKRLIIGGEAWGTKNIYVKDSTW